MESNFEYLCRVCAVNTKGKNSVAECVYILKTPGLKDKIERFLYLTISDNDFFSKVLCKTCFRQVEATASLSNIAKHTQQVFRDFLYSTLPKQLQSAAYNVNISATSAASTTGGATGNYQQQSRQIGQTTFSSSENTNFRPLVLTKAPETTITLAPPAANLSHSNRDEVVISLMKRSNETRPRTKNTAIQQRRNSVFDTRYLNAPVSIAQRGLLPPPVASTSSIQKKTTFEITPSTSTPKSNVGPAVKKPSPSGVINFIQTHGKVTGSTNGYSLLNNMPSSVIQQKRKNLKMALNNIKAVNSGQVSLLKPKQPLQITEDKSSKVSVSVTTVQMNKTLVDESTSIEECLPENIIIAAPKKKREDNAAESPPLIDPSTLRLPTKQDQKSKQHQQPPPPQKQVIKQNQASAKAVPKVTSDINPVSNLTDGISLGGVIRDPDLLKLILKSLKWPVNKNNFEEQMTRLKNAKFAEIISDSNLLQDSDVTQLLGPYIAPVLRAAQALQQNQPIAEQPSKVVEKPIKNPRTAPAKQKSSQSQDQLQNSEVLANTMPYKLPPETSVQLVPSSPTERDVIPTLTITNRKDSKSINQPRNQRRTRTRENSLIISPENDADETHLDAVLMSQYGQSLNLELNIGTGRPRAHRSLSPRTTDAINLEDIVLVEPQPIILQAQPPKNEITCSTKVAISNPTPIELALSAFKLPSQEPPVITRPIIKRRKTVIQSSKSRLDLSVGSTLAKEFKSNATAVSATPTVTKSTEATVTTIDKHTPKVLEEHSPEMPADPRPNLEIPQVPSSTVQEISSANSTIEPSPAPAISTIILSSPDPTPTNTITTTMPIINKTSTISTETMTPNSDATGKSQESLPPVKPSIANRRSGSSKSALGQQLLQAIGLQKLCHRSSNDGQPQSENSRDSLRSALKRSLKQAQEQQLKRAKQEEPVKQVADSTTKSTARESIDDDKQQQNKNGTEKEQTTKRNQNKVIKVEQEVLSIKGEKPDQANVSSSDMTPRRRGRKRKDEQDTVALQKNKQELDVESLASDRWDDDDELPLKLEQDIPTRSSSSTRPARTSKTMSKYYKGPEKTSAKSMHGMGTRASRNRT